MDKKALGANRQGSFEFLPASPPDEPLLIMVRKLEATQRRLLARLEQCLRNSAACLDKQRKNAALIA